MNTRFTWNPAKAARNLRVHGVSFEVATNVFSDRHVVYVDDCETDEGMRYHAIGFALRHLLIVVVYLDLSEEEDEEIIHIIFSPQSGITRGKTLCRAILNIHR